MAFRYKPEVLNDYIKSLDIPGRRAFARAVGAPIQSLRLIGQGHRRASSGMASRIELASKGNVPREVLAEDCAACDVLKRCRKS